MFFTNRQNSASRLKQRKKDKRERKMSLYQFKRERKEGGRDARESVLSEAISLSASRRSLRYLGHFTKDTRANCMRDGHKEKKKTEKQIRWTRNTRWQGLDHQNLRSAFWETHLKITPSRCCCVGFRSRDVPLDFIPHFCLYSICISLYFRTKLSNISIATVRDGSASWKRRTHKIVSLVRLCMINCNLPVIISGMYIGWNEMKK